MLIKYMCDWKSQMLRMHYPFQSTRRPISHQNLSSLHIYMIPFVREFVPEWNSRPGTTTRVNSRQGDSRRHDILCWYHVNKCRAMRRKPEWTHSGAKVAPVSCIQPLIWPNMVVSRLLLWKWSRDPGSTLLCAGNWDLFLAEESSFLKHRCDKEKGQRCSFVSSCMTHSRLI